VIKPVQKGPAFMASLREIPRAGQIFLWWLGQSGFALRYGEGMLAIDPYLSDSLTRKYATTDKPHVRMTENVLEPPLLAAALLTGVVASHHHTDHLDPETLGPITATFKTWGVSLPLVAPEACRTLAAERAGISPAEVVGMDEGWAANVGEFQIIGVPAAHEQIERDENGRCRYLGYVLRCGHWTVYHSGDTVLYDGMVDTLRPFNIDVALLPINGRAPERRVAGNLNGREAAWLAKEIAAKLVIPCHYDMFEFNTADPRDEFIPECERLGQPYKVLRAGERLTLSSSSSS
jgi:L-ascorbate metabolism protein UlaG (beta-lactamase superfamily)